MNLTKLISLRKNLGHLNNMPNSNVHFQEKIIFYLVKTLLKEYKGKNLVIKASSAKLHVQRALIYKMGKKKIAFQTHSEQNRIYIFSI